MHEIIENLYLGNRSDATNNELLKKAGIGAVVNCCTRIEFPTCYLQPGPEYFFVEVEDTSSEPIQDYFLDACNFIENHLGCKNPTLVHCMSGVSRSATVIIAYLILKKNFYLQEAFFHVRSKRDIVCPNIGFMSQLCELEKTVMLGSANKAISLSVPEIIYKEPKSTFDIIVGEHEKSYDYTYHKSSSSSLIKSDGNQRYWLPNQLSSPLDLKKEKEQQQQSRINANATVILHKDYNPNYEAPRQTNKKHSLSWPGKQESNIKISISTKQLEHSTSPSSPAFAGPIHQATDSYQHDTDSSKSNSVPPLSVNYGGRSDSFAFSSSSSSLPQQEPLYETKSAIPSSSSFLTFSPFDITYSIFPEASSSSVNLSHNNVLSPRTIKSHHHSIPSSVNLCFADSAALTKMLTPPLDETVTHVNPYNALIYETSRQTAFRVPSVCMDKYLDWYCCDISARAAVPDLDP